ncbi:hypothetical protein OAA67_03450, partial [Winogradskyella sp.]|nr:hypothetical protein [Winogradskyella sp.]
TAENAQEAEQIFEKTFNDLEKRQERYDNETKRGSKTETQEFWVATVKIELAKYDLYKAN